MARTEIRSIQIKDQEIKRDDLNDTTTGQAVIKKVIAGSGVSLSSTGIDAGTGDVTISVSGTGITTLNTLTATSQTFAVGSTGTDFTINSASSTHTFNIPSSSASNRGLLTSSDWTTFNNKLGTLNTLTASSQTFAVGSTGTDFNINSSGSTHTFNIPDASATNRGLVTTGTQTIAGNKSFTGIITIGANGTNFDGNSIELATNQVADTGSLIDFHAQPSSDYDTRLYRIAGANGNFDILHKGSGNIRILTENSGAINFGTSGSVDWTIQSGGDILGTTKAIRGLYGITASSAQPLRLGANNVDSLWQILPDGTLTSDQVSAPVLNIGNATVSTGTCALQLGNARTGSGNSLIDLIADTTYTDYGLRLVRESGTNGNTNLIHRGTGELNFIVQEAGLISFRTSNTTRWVIDSGGDLTGQTKAINGLYGLFATSGQPLRLGSNATEHWNINTSGHLLPSTHLTYNIGSTSGPFRVNGIFATQLDLADPGAGSNTFFFGNTNGSATGALLYGYFNRASTASYRFIEFYSGGATGDREFNFEGDGNAYCDGAFTGGGADYAEYFESTTGLEIAIGKTVVLSNGKVREFNANTDTASDIIGVVRPKRGGSAIVGNMPQKWHNKYLRDDFGAYILDQDGQRQLNPQYNENESYVSRQDRPEWVLIGLVGQVVLYATETKHPNWIKMEDVGQDKERYFIK